MRFRNAFDVPLPPEEAWAVLMDIQRVVPCMPGAALTEQIDDQTYKGNVAVRLGPVALKFAGTAVFEAIDPAARTARVKAAGTDAKGRGGANSLVTFAITPLDAGSHVVVDTDLSLSGSIAQYGRGAGMIQEVAAQLIKQFASALREQLKTEREQTLVPETRSPVAACATAASGHAEIATAHSQASALPASASVKPISGLSLLLKGTCGDRCWVCSAGAPHPDPGRLAPAA